MCGRRVWSRCSSATCRATHPSHRQRPRCPTPAPAPTRWRSCGATASNCRRRHAPAGKRRLRNAQAGDTCLPATRCTSSHATAELEAAAAARAAGVARTSSATRSKARAANGQGARRLARAVARRGEPFARPCVMLSGGETTVTVRHAAARWPRDRILLGCAIGCRANRVYVLAADTDGIDGIEDNAGAIVTPGTLARASAMGLKRPTSCTATTPTTSSSHWDLVVPGPPSQRQRLPRAVHRLTMLKTLKDLFNAVLPRRPAAPPRHRAHTGAGHRRAAGGSDACQREVGAPSAMPCWLRCATSSRCPPTRATPARAGRPHGTRGHRLLRLHVEDQRVVHDGTEAAHDRTHVRVAYADGALSAHENTSCEGVDLLHIPHGAYVSPRCGRATRAGGRCAGRPIDGASS